MNSSSLEHYFSVAEGKKLPKFLEARKKTKAGSSLLEKKTKEANRMLSSCEFCEHKCKVDRRKALGACKVGKDSFVSSAFVHLGEEPELVPSGTIFFSGCNFTCCFCQNYDISQNPKQGYKWTPNMIAAWAHGMRNGIKNLNLVGGEPTVHLHNIMNSLLALEARMPIIWNSNMYMSEETMGILDGAIDLYLADFKYGNDECAKKLSGAGNYFSVASRNHLLANKSASLLIRHLVLPGHSECCSKPILDWIGKNLGLQTRVNIMGQYSPEYKAKNGLKRNITKKEYADLVNYAKNEVGLTNLGK